MSKFLKGIAAIAMASVDKQSASQLGATAARSVAGRNAHPGVKFVAGLVAEGLSATAQRPGVAPPQGGSAPGRQPSTGGAGNDGWLQARQVLQQAARQRTEARSTSTEPVNSVGATNTRPEAGRVVSRGTLSGQYDTANIGAFSFSWYRGIQLQVNQLRVSGNIGGQYWMADIVPGTWHRLTDRGGRVLPVWVAKDGIDLDVQVGDGPSGAPILKPTDMLPRAT